jgi:hypothetical protein
LYLGVAAFFAAAMMSGLAAETTPASPSPAPAAEQRPALSLSNGPALPRSNAYAVEALGLLLQVISQLEDYVLREDLASVHNEDAFLSSALGAIRFSARRRDEGDRLSPAQQREFDQALEVFGSEVGQLHAVADARRLREAKEQLVAVRRAFDKLPAYFSAATLANAREMAATYLCPLHPEKLGRREDLCPKCGYALHQLHRLLPGRGLSAPVPLRTAKAQIQTPKPLAAGEATTAVLSLAKMDGSPLLAKELALTHTRRVHLLLVDASLTDYHHEHPEPLPQPGRYQFRFTPQLPGPYFAWADLRPLPMGLQEFAMTSMAGAVDSSPTVSRVVTNATTAGGLRFELVFEQKPLVASRPVTARLKVQQRDGAPFAQLEPVMESFTHLVGFCEERQSALHFHPKGAVVTNPEARGGPELEFVFYAPRAGFIKLFAQVQVKGASIMAPFGVVVLDPNSPEALCAPAK